VVVVVVVEQETLLPCQRHCSEFQKMAMLERVERVELP
jgi:hypothetical protein